MMTSTLQELREASSTIKARLTAAYMSADDEDLIAALEAERSALPHRLYRAERVHLQEEIAQRKLDIPALKIAALEAAAPARAMRENILSLQKELPLLDRVADIAEKELKREKEDLAALEARLQALIDKQTNFAESTSGQESERRAYAPRP